MRRVSALVGATILLAAVAAPVVAATSTFKAVIHEDFGRRAVARPCFEIGDRFACEGDGTVQGYGQVESLVIFPADPEDPIERILTFGDGSTLTTNETFLDERLPGRSVEAPDRGYGNPVYDHYAWVIVGGTGRFAGASGSGEWVNVLAGDVIVLKFVGTLTLP